MEGRLRVRDREGSEKRHDGRWRRCAPAGWRQRMVRSFLCILALLGATLGSARPAHADANALWHIVGEHCVPDEKDNHSPRPCEEVNLAGGYAVLKDIVGKTQFLLIPTTRISGIESPTILAPNAPNYWEAAWQARRFVDERAQRQLPRDVIGLAINSISGRTQNELHIHIDCMRPDVISALREHAAAIGPKWTRFPVPLSGHDYMAMRLDQATLADTNPFVLLADGVPGARADMGHETLVVVGDKYHGKDDFVLLAGHANPATGNWGAGEQLQDHSCAAASFSAQ
jgi:CDP-diacylglycerol pyrophosphatase